MMINFFAPVAQLDRVADFESVGRGFEPLLARHMNDFRAEMLFFYLEGRLRTESPKLFHPWNMATKRIVDSKMLSMRFMVGGSSPSWRTSNDKDF